jgi:hypothetical protein
VPFSRQQGKMRVASRLLHFNSATFALVAVKPSKARRQIAWEAARLINEQPELRRSDARRSAAERLYPDGIRARDLPTDEEVGEQLRSIAKVSQGREWEHRYKIYQELLEPLALVLQDPLTHPEGDALYHSLQVFQLCEDRIPYDEELLTAALLHDVGKAIDRRDHHSATLSVLNEIVTERTLWLIEFMPQAAAYAKGTLGIRARNRIEATADFDELLILSESDLAGRKRGVVVPELEEAIAVLRELSIASDE